MCQKHSFVSKGNSSGTVIGVKRNQDVLSLYLLFSVDNYYHIIWHCNVVEGVILDIGTDIEIHCSHSFSDI